MFADRHTMPKNIYISHNPLRKGQGQTLDTVPLSEGTSVLRAQVWHALSKDFTVLPTQPHHYPYPTLPSQPQLVLIYRPHRMEG